MSMIRCDECERLIDSDFDADCFTETDEVICESCRDNAAERAYERFVEAFHSGEIVTLREQQEAARRLK